MHNGHSSVRSALKSAVLYSVANLGASAARVWRETGKLQLLHPERLPRKPGPVIYIANHESMAEGVFLPFVLCRPFPIRLNRIPYSTPDQSNFHDRWQFAWARPAFIEIDRGNPASEMAAFRRIIEVLKQGRSVILFPEAGRTSTGNGPRVKSPSGRHEVKPFKESLGRILQHLERCTVVPLWVEGGSKLVPRGTWRPHFSQPVTIVVGEPVVYEEAANQLVGAKRRGRAAEITQDNQTRVLALADEIP